MKFRKVLPVLAVAAVLPLSACGPKEEDKHYTLNTYLSVSPSNWNELTYQDNNDTEIMGYIGGSFFSFDFEYDAKGEIVPGGFTVTYQAVKAMQDVTASLGAQGKYGLTSEDKAGKAYKMTLRDDLKWDDGTPIKAQDFVYTMKQQLDPAYENYRADSYYVGSVVVHNAENYFKQGSIADFDNANTEEITGKADLTNSGGVYSFGEGAKFAFGAASAWCSGDALVDYESYLEPTAFAALSALADDNGYVAITDETITLMGQLISTESWNETADNWPAYIVYQKNMPAMDFSEVGLFAEDDYNLTIVLDNALELFDENGKLTYHAPYEFSSLPLVKESLFEECRVAADPNTPGSLPSYKYNTSVETTASWGPYKLTQFQAGKQYKLEKNPNYYGFNMEENKGKYQTEAIVVDIIEEQATAWQMFLKGDLDAIGISPAIGNVDYKTSSRAYFVASDFVASMQLQSDATALKGREEAGIDKEILSYVEFRKAISLCVNRAEYASKTTTASLAGFGLFNSMHYYDVANAGVYRNTSYAKKVICDVYGVEYTDATLDDKYATITGYDPAQAKKLFDAAYDKAFNDGKISATDKVELTFGTSALTESTQLQYNTLSDMIKEGVKGTKLEGRLVTELEDHGTKWATDFRNGGYDVCTGGWSGAAWNPGYFLLAYLSPSYMYSKAWDTSAAMLTFKPEGHTQEETMSLIDWYNCLNGASGAKYNWGEGKVAQNFRLSIIAALEKEVLSVYYSVPLYNSYSASLLYKKVDYCTQDYNTFMGFGGIKNMTFNYTDSEWEGVKGTIDYKA